MKERSESMKKNKELNDAFNAGMTALGAKQYDAAIPVLNQILPLLRTDNRTLLRYRFYVANLEFKAGNAGKTKEASEAAYAAVIAAARAYFDASPRADVIQDIEDVFSAGFQGAEWQFCQKTKQEFFAQSSAGSTPRR